VIGLTARAVARRAVPFVAVLVAPAAALAQGNPSRASIDGGVTIERLVSEYRFDSPSSFSGDGLVPHFFVQHYEATVPWVVARARYPVGQRSGETTIGYAPGHRASGSDFDTFFQPDGDVVVSGTAGDVRLRGFSIDQRLALAGTRDWTIGVTGRYTIRDADFLPADRVVTHTDPPSETREFITTRELTASHEIRIGLSAAWARRLGRGWRFEGDGAAWPAVRGRLVTELPDKYPGQDIVFDATGLGGEANGAFVRRAGGLRFAVTARLGGLLPYRRSASLRQHAFSLGVSVGVGGAN
jgi:hypothetical protein